jgi:sulfatase maturation enzyme AslB (radical SAM superfamily)
MEEFNTIKKEMERRLQEFADKADFSPECIHCERTQCCGGIDPHFHYEDGADLGAWSDLLARLEALFRKKYRLPPKD